ncbi:MAG: discoidin domain-containing protein [Acidimicrobiia bacterium]
MRRLLLLALIPLTLTVTACSKSPQLSGVEVKPFEQVQASDFTFDTDPTDPGRGVFHVTTTEPMICAIVWGEGESMGNFNNSLAMAGTGITQHDVFLPGAEPGVPYMFVVEGIAADGSLYRSDVGTFTLPETSGDISTTTIEERPNLATSGTVVEFSSEFNSAFAAEKAIDGDLSTEWSTAGDGNSASITIDLGESVQVTGFEFITRSMADGTAITDAYTVTVDDGETLGPFPAGDPGNFRPSDVEVTGRRFTFAVESSSGGNTGAVEIRILG